MRFFKKLDRSSKVLVAIAVAGILFSLIGLYTSFFSEADEWEGKNPLAIITLHQQDTRLKRSGNVHWYEVAKRLPCFEDDMVFTGDDSYATIEFPQGDKIQLQPNSLISISNNLISLESGAIDVDLIGKAGAPSLAIETFGKVIKIEEKSSFKIINKPNEQRIIPVTGKAPSPKLVSPVMVKKDDLSVVSPRAGQLIPLVPDGRITLSWTYSGTSSNFQLEVNGKTFQTTQSRYELPLGSYSPGKVEWTVKAAKGETAQSSFVTTNDYAIDLLQPKTNQILLSKEDAKTITFEWTNRLSYSQRLIVARDEGMKDIAFEQNVNGTTFERALPTGDYFWKVAYLTQDRIIYASPAQAFKIQPEVRPTLALKTLPLVFDFATQSKYQLEVDASHPMDEVSVRILGQNNKIDGLIKGNSFFLKALRDGSYELFLYGKAKGGQEVRSETYNFKVKNAKPVESPKITVKKMKLFVKVFSHMLDFIFPSAHAATSVPLTWEGKANHSYELEIRERGNDKLILRKELKVNRFDFSIPHPGTYTWKVRQKRGETWGPFSNDVEIFVEDKISVLKDPLMLKTTVKDDDVTFYWSEPYDDFQYELEIYKKGSKTPMISLPVKGGVKTMNLRRKDEKLFWRVKAISGYGNKNANQKKYLIPLEGEQLIGKVASKESSKEQIIWRAYGYQTQSSYEQKADDAVLEAANESLSLTGLSLESNLEWWPNRLKNKYGAQAGFRMHQLTDGENDMNETEFSFEVGYQPQPTIRRHKFFTGFNYSVVNLLFAETEGNYSRAYVTFRHHYQKMFSPKWGLDMDTALLLPVQFDITAPSFRLRPALSWYFKPNWCLQGTLSYERNTLNPVYDESGLKGKLDVTSSFLSLGLGITWHSF